MSSILAALSALVVLGGLIGGCSSRDHHDRMANDRDGYYSPTTRDNRDSWNRLHTDPVCGMTVNPRQALKESYDGSVYYFDSEECRRKFHDNPQAYLRDWDDRRTPDDRRPRDVR